MPVSLALALGKDPAQKSLTEVVKRTLNARDLDDVDPDGNIA